MSGYIGTQPVPQATQTRDSFTATSGQTSFATGGYTPNFLDVYLNGVKLAAADYTATNGSDVVLASGASTGDILEVVAFTTFTPADLPAGTPSIDDNGNAVALTIDSNENVLVGQTTNALADTGHILDSTGTAYHIRDGASPLILNRKSSDGSITEFYKDGSTVGAISTKSDDLVIHSSTTNHVGLSFGSGNVIPTNNYGTTSNNTVDLGSTSRRFKDFYLDGGVYLGGTGAANKLEDYETGGWTPTLAASGYTFAYRASTEGRYVKIGSLVHINGYIRLSSNPSGSGTTGIQITGLPFTVSPVNASSYTAGSMIVEGSGSVFSGIPIPRPNQNTTIMPVYQLRAGQSPLNSGVNVANITSTMEFEFQITYHTQS